MKCKKKLIELILFSLVVIVFCEGTIYIKHPEPDLLALATMGQEFRASPGMLFRAAVDKGWDMSKVDIKGLKRKKDLYYGHFIGHYYKSKSLKEGEKLKEAEKYASIYAVDWEFDEKPWKYMFTHSRNRTRDNLAIFAGRLIGTGLIVLPLALFGFMIFIIIRLYHNKKERQAQEKAERKEQLRKKQEEEKRKFVEMEARFNAVYFPPQNIGDTSFTYEIQKFFEAHSGNNIIFKGYLKNIEKTEDNIIYAEFFCPIGNYYLIETAICFRLAVPENKLDQFSEAKHSNLMPRPLPFLFVSDYFVVSEINKIQRVRKHKFDGTANGEEVEIETEGSRGIVALGHLIEAVATTKEEGSTNKGGGS